jgi:hypothetical protein
MSMQASIVVRRVVCQIPGDVLAGNARAVLGENSRFVVDADLAKPADVLIPAYADDQGVTAAFNKNVLTRLNREFDADFDLESFEHLAVWNSVASRIEMHLVSRRKQRVEIGGWVLEFEPGETIHTENSYKYEPAAFADLAERAGWGEAATYLDPSPTFGIFCAGVLKVAGRCPGSRNRPSKLAFNSPAQELVCCVSKIVAASVRAARRMAWGGRPNERRKARRMRSGSAKPVSIATNSVG